MDCTDIARIARYCMDCEVLQSIATVLQGVSTLNKAIFMNQYTKIE